MSPGALALLVAAWLAASLVWGALVCALAERRAAWREGWPSYWLACVICAVAPLLSVPAMALVRLPVSSAQVDAGVALADWSAPLQRHGAGAGAELFALALAALFGLGLAHGVWTLVRGRRRADAIVRNASAADDAALSGSVRLLVSDADAPIFCVGGARPAIVLSRPLLARMSDEQVRLVVAHELAHVKRGDPLLFAALACLDTLFWFNPFVRRLTQRARLAAEIACDAAVLGAAEARRKLYAGALVRALESGTESVGAAPAFGQNARAARVRLAHILRGAGRRRGAVLSAALIAAAFLLSFSGAALAASTARLGVFGDPVLLSALEARVLTLYGAARCAPSTIEGERK